MNCIICQRGDTQPGVTTLTLTRDSLTFLVKNAPAQVCDNCGEAYVDETTAQRVLESTEQAARASMQVKVRE